MELISSLLKKFAVQLGFLGTTTTAQKLAPKVSWLVHKVLPYL